MKNSKKVLRVTSIFSVMLESCHFNLIQQFNSSIHAPPTTIKKKRERKYQIKSGELGRGTEGQGGGWWKLHKMS